MSETLTQFGTSFQSKIIASLLRNIKFIQTISDILEPIMFDSDSNKWLVKIIREYFYEYKKQQKSSMYYEWRYGLYTKCIYDAKRWL